MLNQPPSGGTGTQLLQRSGNDATRYLMPVFGHHRDLAGDVIPESRAPAGLGRDRAVHTARCCAATAACSPACC
jgi:hypothetical protein